MLKSMTGFGSGTSENDNYKIQVEIKAVNQRYLDVDFHAPRILFPYEDGVRACIKKHAARGKLSIFVSFTDKRSEQVTVSLNRDLALAYHKAFEELSELLHVAATDELKTIATFPEVLLTEKQENSEDYKNILLEATETAISCLDAMRRQEGEHLRQDFLPRLTAIEDMAAALEELAPQIIAAYREKLRDVVQETLAGEIDETRLVQEVALYADKVNFTEEIVRLRSHVSQFRRLLQADEPTGRKLDFLLQEMNREANTIGSKANNAEAAHVVVDLKGEIEKIREQVQNIE